jgi:hypothetical protein
MDKHDGGKGDVPRPLGVTMEEFDKNFDRIFKKEKNGSLTVNVDAEQGEASVTVNKTWEIE